MQWLDVPDAETNLPSERSETPARRSVKQRVVSRKASGGFDGITENAITLDARFGFVPNRAFLCGFAGGWWGSVYCAAGRSGLLPCGGRGGREAEIFFGVRGRDKLTSIIKRNTIKLQNGFACFPDGDPLNENVKKVKEKIRANY